MIQLDFDLTDLEAKNDHLMKLMDDKIDELAKTAPELNIREYLQRLVDEFDEKPFLPHDNYWEEELGRLFDNLDSEEGQKS